MLLRRLSLALAMAISTVVARAHDGYHDWVNRLGQGCCNNRDCRPLPASRLRTHEGRLQALVEAAGQSAWCDILPHHYLRRGNAPDPSTAHICVTSFYSGRTPCEQLVCFQPAAQF